MKIYIVQNIEPFWQCAIFKIFVNDEWIANGSRLTVYVKIEAKWKPSVKP